MTKSVVFGANGFIGQHLVKALAENEAMEVVAFDRFSKFKQGDTHPFTDYPNVSVVAGNFFNRDELTSVLDQATYVFHFISSTTPATSNKDPFIDIDTNVRGSIELFELCVEHGVKKVIFPSSGGTIYGDIESEKISETTVPIPRSPYGIGKLAIEQYLRYFKHSHGLDYIVYRIANPYGPGQNINGKQGVIPIFMNRFLHHEPITIYGDGSMIRDYLYIDDLIAMIMASYAKSNQFCEYNLGSGRGFSVNEIVSVIESCADFNVERQFVEVPPTFVQSSVLDMQRFISEFGDQTFTSLEKGIEKTWDYVKQLN